MSSLTLERLNELEQLARAATAFPGYSVDADGNVWSEIGWRGHASRKLTPQPNSYGYLRVKVKTEAGMRYAFVHKMVSVAFHGPKPSPQHEVRHINGDRRDNRAVNLASGTRAENAADRTRHGRCRGAENGRKSAHKRIGVFRRTHCLRGHDKEGRPGCEQCRREKYARERRCLKSTSTN